MGKPDGIATRLLAWYDAQARDLPWRVSPAARRRGVAPDPYRVWLSEIMLQQTTVATVAPRYGAFLEKWPTVEAMARASVDDVTAEWAGLGYYARARNLHKCAVEVAARGGFPTREDGLRALPGVGPYTAAAIAAIAFDAPAIVIDGNVERVASRLFAISTPLPKSKPEIKAAIGAIWPDQRSGDFAQALMDLGATICTPKNPSCPSCPLASFCEAPKGGKPDAYPVRMPKKPKPERRGVAYALFNSRGHVLLERRQDKGLLGGMLCLPTTDWVEGSPSPAPPASADWRSAGEVVHVFTHFRLTLQVVTARSQKRYAFQAAQSWHDPHVARLPTVMNKSLAAAMREFQPRE